jgi:pantoate--beta-alanine ligase
MPLEIVTTKAELRARVAQARGARGERIAFVPTMGALHEGHLALIHEAKRRAGFVLASIFVNPTQFGPKEDLAKYPRDLPGDAEKLRGAGADLLFAPAVEEVYPKGFQTFVEVQAASQGLCGEVRPGHFRGVATVVAKLLSMARPDVAIFGEKDFQQLAVIRALTRDLDLDVEIVGYPTVREPDGLAMSSRNAYLSPAERARAVRISRGLSRAVSAAASGERDAARLLALAREEIAPAVDELQYLEIRDAETLASLSTLTAPARIFCAAKVGATRLIDNMGL